MEDKNRELGDCVNKGTDLEKVERRLINKKIDKILHLISLDNFFPHHIILVYILKDFE